MVKVPNLNCHEWVPCAANLLSLWNITSLCLNTSTYIQCTWISNLIVMKCGFRSTFVFDSFELFREVKNIILDWCVCWISKPNTVTITLANKYLLIACWQLYNTTHARLIDGLGFVRSTSSFKAQHQWVALCAMLDWVFVVHTGSCWTHTRTQTVTLAAHAHQDRYFLLLLYTTLPPIHRNSNIQLLSLQ